MQIEIEGTNAVMASQDLLSIEGIEGSYEIIDELEREGTIITTIATIVGITVGIMTVAEKLYQWKQKYQNAQLKATDAKIEKVMIVSPSGNRLLLKDATLEQIKEILED